MVERRQWWILLGAAGAVIVLLVLTGWALVRLFGAASQQRAAQVTSTAAMASANTAAVDLTTAQVASTAAVDSAGTAVADRAMAQATSTAAVAGESAAIAAKNTAVAAKNTVASGAVATAVANYQWLLTQEASAGSTASPQATVQAGTGQPPTATPTPDVAATLRVQLQIAQATQTALALRQVAVRSAAAATPAPMSPKPGVVLDFEQFGVWRRGDEPYGTFTQSSEQAHEGTFSGKLTYNIPAVQNHYVVFQRVPPAPIFGTPQTLTVWVYGDGSGNFLNAWIKDSQGEVRQFTFRRITHADGWQPMTLQLDTSAPWPQGHISGPDNSQLDYPISFQGFVLDAFPRSDISTYTGTVYLDELRTGEVPAPAATAAAVETAVVTSTIPATTRRATPAGATPVARQQAGATPAPTQPPRRPVAPLTGRIVYAQGSGGTSNLMVVNAADGATSWLAADARQPDVRADGRVIFDGIGGGKLNLWSIYLDGSKLREVSPHPEDSYPSWAPSGEGAVFYSTQHGDKKERVYIQQDTTRVEEPVTLKVNGKDAFGRTPTWLGNGRIAFSGCDYWAGGSQCGIWAVNSDGSGGPLQLTERADDRSTDSANGTLLYASQGSGNWEVFAVPETGGTPVNLTNSPSQDLGATFSPDGNHIAFISDREGGWGIWIMNTDGSNAEKLIAVPDGFGPSWSEERLTWGP
jgi:Tol biopolymer transport system component